MDVINDLEIILTYFEQLNAFNDSRVKLIKFQDQRNNVKNLKLMLEDFQTKKINFSAVEKHDTNDTQKKLMAIAEFMENLSWYVSEMQDLNVEMVKTRIGVRNN